MASHWTVHKQQIAPGTIRVSFSADAALSNSDILRLWREHASFRSFFTRSLAESGFDAFFWETPALTVSTLDRTFECVVVDGPPLRRLVADPRPFSEHFRKPTLPSSTSVLSFPNLSGDALLVVPCPAASTTECYAHLGRFLREAPAAQVDFFWQAVAEAVQQRVSAQPLWLSTAGLGVSWLHFRLDSCPKYYRHRPYTLLS